MNSVLANIKVYNKPQNFWNLAISIYNQMRYLYIQIDIDILQILNTKLLIIMLVVDISIILYYIFWCKYEDSYSHKFKCKCKIIYKCNMFFINIFDYLLTYRQTKYNAQKISFKN